MGTFSIYLTKQEQEKVSRIAQLHDIPKGGVVRIIITSFEEDYLRQIVQTYKDNLK